MALSSTGITVSAVKGALGTTSTDVGTLCSSPLVNPWSKWKPISLDAVTLTATLLKNANYGISIQYATTASALLTNVKNNGNLGFTYNKPTGIKTSPYRLGDFRNYDHQALLPLHTHYNDGDEQPINGVSSSYTVTLMGIESPDTEDESTTYLVRRELYPTNVTNRGALITDGTNTYWSVGDIPWGNSNWQKFKGKNVTVLEFLTNLSSGKNSTNHTSTSNDRFYALPYPLHTISVLNTSPAGSKTVFVDTSRSINGFFMSTNNQSVTYSFQFSSVGDVYIGGTLNNVYIGLYRDADCTDVITQYKLADTINVGSEEQTSTYSGSLTNTGGSMAVYVGMYWNYSKQWSTVPMQRPQLQNEE